MSFLRSLRDEGLAARRGVITLFGVTGWGLTYWWKADGEPDYPRLLLGLTCIAICVGLWRNGRWARWVALGCCYLAIIAAFVMPVFLALRPQVNADGGQAIGVEVFICGSAAAIAVIAYKGLGYFRSPAAWHAFSGNPSQREALAAESSLQTLVSAVFVATVLGFLAMARVTTASVEANPKKGSATKRPDLVINSLCMSGVNLVQAEVRNIGLGSAAGKYYIEYTDLRGIQGADGGGGESFGEVPSPGTSTYVVLDNSVSPTEEQAGAHLRVNLEVDSRHSIRESNENNNAVSFDLVFGAAYPRNLPRCPGSPESRRDSAAPATGQPDLVFNALCKDPENRVRAEVQNRGNRIDTRWFLITVSSLRGASRTSSSWAEIPAAGESTWIMLNNAIEKGGIYKVRNFELIVDSDRDVSESNEDNNRVTLTNVSEHSYTFERDDGEISVRSMISCNVEAS